MTTLAETPLSDLTDLNGKVAVVTGAGRSMGRAIALRLAEAGATVYVTDLDMAAAEKVVDEIQAKGGKAEAASLDVSDSGAMASLASQAVADTGRLDIWVNNAGIYPMTPFFATTDEDWARMTDTNLRSVFVAIREAARQMITVGTPGVVINISSIAAYRAGHPNLAHYAASKAGVVTLTKTLAGALGPHGVRVVGVAPGVIETEGMLSVKESFESAGVNAANRGEEIPLMRGGQPDDIARVVLFLASDLAGFISGVTIPVDGGDLIGGRNASIVQLDALGLGL